MPPFFGKHSVFFEHIVNGEHFKHKTKRKQIKVNVDE